MPVTDDMAEATNKTKQELQQALLDLLKGNPDILNSVTQATFKQGGHAAQETSPRSGDEVGGRGRKSPTMSSFREEENQLNQPLRTSYQWQLSDSDDGIDSAWTTATRNMSPQKLVKWRRSLFSIYVGHLPYDITKKELVQLFSEVGTVQDVHLQPGKDRTYTYGFIRFCTLDECRDAVSLLHGRLLGNRTITVEYACETKERLQGDDPNDYPQDKRDKLLRNDFPRAEHLHRPMSTAESQEKMVLWKLRCSATRLKSSPVISGQESKEELMNKIQEIVRKVASLSADTHALPSGSEGSPCSPWIFNEINGNNVHEENAQSLSERHITDSFKEQNKAFENVELQLTEVTKKEPVKKDLLQMPERQGHSPESNSLSFSFPDRVQRIGLDPSEDALASSAPGSPATGTCNSSLSDSVSLGSVSPERQTRQHCQFCHSVNPSPGHHSESSQSESTSSSSCHHSPSRGTFCCEGEKIVRKQDDFSLVPERDTDIGQYGMETHPGCANQYGICHSPPRDNHQSGMGLCSFDSGGDYLTKPTSITSQLGNRYAHQQMINGQPNALKSGFLIGHKQTQFSSVMSQQNEPCASRFSNKKPIDNCSQANSRFVHQGLCPDSQNSKITNLHTIHQTPAPHSPKVPEKEPPSVKTQYPNAERMRGPPFSQQGLLSDPVNPEKMGVIKEDSRRTLHSSVVTQPQQDSVPSHNLNREKVQVDNEANKPLAQQGLLVGGFAFENIRVVEEGSRRTHHSLTSTQPQQAPGERRKGERRKEKVQVDDEADKPIAQHGVLRGPFGPKSTSEVAPIATPVPGHQLNQEKAQIVNEANNPFTKQQLPRGPFGHQNASIVPVAKPPQGYVSSHRPNEAKVQVLDEGNKPLTNQKPLVKPSVESKDLHTEGQMRQAHYSPDESEPQQTHVPAQPFAQQSLFSYPPLANLLGQSQHIQAMQLANIMACRWPQPGFPTLPFVTPDALNPSILQNPLLQQQLLASRMPFGSPFHRGERHSSPRFGFGARKPVSHQGQRHPIPFGRGRQFAPTFHTPAGPDVRHPAESDTSVSERLNAVSLDTKMTDKRSASNGSPKGNARSPAKPSASKVTQVHVDPAGQELVPPLQSQKSPNAEKFKAISPISSAANLPLGCTLPKYDGNLESPEANKSASKLTQSELHLREEKAELKRIVSENESLRQFIDWRNSGGTFNGDAKEKRDALRAEIHNKEVQLQKEKEIVMARKGEQEIIYEREKLEAAFDQQLKKELETEKKLGETKNKIYLARLENELLRSYQDLHGVTAHAT